MSISSTAISTPFVTKNPTTTIHNPVVISQVHDVTTTITTGTTQMANPPNRMQLIVASRYAPLVLPIALHDFPQVDYLKYLPKFTGEGDVIAEEHLISFYNYADNQNIEHEVWTRLFVQSLDGEARKWFSELPVGSITGIDALYASFLRHWGDRRDYLYYITEFGALKLKNGESLSYFTKRFNKMYQKIPNEIKPSETAAMIAYAIAFEAIFSLFLRERRSLNLEIMK